MLIPSEVSHILNTLNENHHKAYVVGGCVRDGLLLKEPTDWDITTSALPGEVKALFPRTYDTGIQHGTVTVVENDRNYEITTFRTEGAYVDHRRPEKVEFTSSIEEDLSRRDFTMNAIAFHPREGFIDPFSGKEDIQKRQIRAVGNPDLRFTEDALRMVRAVRFSAQLDFEIEKETFRAIKDHAPLLQSISAERIREELNKLLLSSHPMKLLLLRETGILSLLLPEFEACFHVEQKNPHHVYNVGLHSLHAASHIENVLELRWAMLLHDLGKAHTKTTDEKGIDHFYGHMAVSEKLAKNILRRLKFDNRTTNTICRLIYFHDRPIEPREKVLKKALLAMGDDLFLDLMKVKRADKRAQHPDFMVSGLEAVEKVQALYFEIKNRKECFQLKDLAVNGQDLINIGFQKDSSIGTLLDQLLEAVIENPGLNTKEQLLALAKSYKSL